MANVDSFSVLQIASIKVLGHCFLPLIRNDGTVKNFSWFSDLILFIRDNS